MKKKVLSFLFLLLLSAMLNAASIIGEKPENPFPSVENLAYFDFLNGDDSYKDYQFNILVTKEGDDLYTQFGHCGLEVITPNGSHFVCDWGVFIFGYDFYFNFMKGKLFYRMKISPLSYSLRKSAREERDLERLPLIVSDNAKRPLVDFIEYNNLPENTTYLYDFYFDNCATRIRDIYNATTNDDFKLWAEGQDTGLTLRQLSNTHLSSRPLTLWVLNYLEGNMVDEKASLYDALFLPMYLEDAIARYQGNEPVNIASYKERGGALEYTPVLPTLFSILLSALFLFAFKKSRRFYSLLLFILSLFLFALSSVLTFLMFFSMHSCTYFNENLIVLNPTVFFVTISSFRTILKKERSLYRVKCYFILLSIISVLLLALKLILPNVFYQDNLEIVIPLLVFFLFQALTLRKEKPRS